MKHTKKTVRNILSCTRGTLFTGKEIKEWIDYHTNNETSKTKIANSLSKYTNINDTHLYAVRKDPYSKSSNQFILVKYAY